MAAGSTRSQRDSKMAGDLKSRGIFHGMRGSVTHAPAVPDMKHVGSAAFRRRQAAKA